MTAPALVLLASGSTDPAAAQVVHRMRQGLQQMRPGLDVHVAFADQCPPSGPQVVTGLVRRGVSEVVFVPLDITRAFGTDETVTALLRNVRATHPGLRVAAARPIGPEASLLSLVDVELREALRRSRCAELDALVLATAAQHDPRGAAVLARRARQWSSHHRLPVVLADGTAGLAEAVHSLQAQGRRHLAVGSWHLVADEVMRQQRELARSLGVSAVSGALGHHASLLDIALARYAVAAMELVTFDGEESAATPVEPTGRHLHAVGA